MKEAQLSEWAKHQKPVSIGACEVCCTLKWYITESTENLTLQQMLVKRYGISEYLADACIACTLASGHIEPVPDDVIGYALTTRGLVTLCNRLRTHYQGLGNADWRGHRLDHE